MGFRPEDIDNMSIWQFNAAAIGWAKQYQDPDKPSESDMDEIWNWMNNKEDGIPRSSKKFKPNGH